MYKVRFELTHPDMNFQEVLENMKAAYAGSDYASRTEDLIKDKIILWRETSIEDGKCVFYSYWSSKEANEIWTQSIYDTPATKLFYDNLHNMGFTFVIDKEEIED